MLDQAIDVFLSRTTLRQIEVMVGRQKHGSMSKTAEALDMSVANVSRMTKRFERNLDVRLFYGNLRRLALRDDAHEILDRLTGTSGRRNVPGIKPCQCTRSTGI